jgi:hypothetical protein
MAEIHVKAPHVINPMEMNRRLRVSVENLTTELGKFKTSSDKLSKTAIRLTKWLIGLTIVVVILTIILGPPGEQPGRHGR